MSGCLSRARWPDVERWPAHTATLAVPVGSTEQHGPHLPLSTDTDIAVALTDRLAGELPDVAVAPPVAYGASGEHQDFPGTLSIGQEALERLLVELGRSATHSFARIVFVSTHGGNAAPVRRAVGRLTVEERPTFAWSPDWSGDAHAGRTETALMLALHPTLVHRGIARAGNQESLSTLLPALRVGGVRAVSANGVLGDPTGATAGEGRRLLTVATRDLVAAVAGWAGNLAR